MADGDALEWFPVVVLAVGPKADGARATRQLGGEARAEISGASVVVEDGRMHVAASGVCLLPAGGGPGVVLSSVATVAPFLARRPMPAEDPEAPRGSMKWASSDGGLVQGVRGELGGCQRLASGV